MKKLLLALILCSLFTAVRAQLITWAAAAENQGAVIKTDAIGNIYKAGSSKNWTLGWSLEKYNAAGVLQWHIEDGGTAQGGVGITHMTISNTGDIYLYATMRIGSPIGIDSLPVTGLADYALVKYNNQGQMQWYKWLTGPANDGEYFNGLSITSTGNIVAQGYYLNTCTFAGNTFSNTGRHIFWGIFDPNGNTVAMVDVPGFASNSTASILDANDNLLVAGFSFTSIVNSLYKFDLAGNLIWTWAAGQGSGQFTGIAIDNAGEIYMTGEFGSASDFGGTVYTPAGGSGSDALVIQIHPNGSFGWFKQLGGSNLDNSQTIAINANGDLFITGFYYLNSMFDGITLSSMGGGHDIFFASLSNTGTVRWAIPGGTAANDQGHSITYDGFNDRLLCTGYVASSSGATFGNYALPGGNDGYIVELGDQASMIKGNVFRDNNNNGIRDVGDQDFPNIMIRVSPGATWTNSAYTGAYNIFSGLGNFTLDLPNIPNYYVQTGPTTHTANFTAYGQIDSLNDFGLYATANINDLQVTITPTRTLLRASATNGYILTYKNVGTTFLSGAQVSFEFDPSLTYLPSLPAPVVNVPGQLVWNLPTLYPLDVGTIIVYLDAPALTIGSTVDFAAEISHVLVEQTPADNVDSLTHFVSNSYDPNEKVVFPAGDIAPAQVAAGIALDYTIHFQNTGNDTAFVVKLVDTLSSNLDLGTFQWVAESHASTWHIDANNVLTIDFAGINLLDSLHNEPESHGFFRYSVQPKTALILGDRIENTAHIYFDFNPAIVTNTTITQVANPVAVYAEQGKAQLRAYPIPAQEQLHFMWVEKALPKAELVLMDTYGRICTVANLDAQGAQIDVSNLAAGIYLYRVVQAGKLLEMGKVVVAH